MQALEWIAAHRVLTTAQIRALRGQDASARWTLELLGDLERRGLITHVLANRRHKLWHLSARGAELTARLGGHDRPPKVLASEEASGALQAHTLAVNDAAIAWLEAARERGDDFGPVSWRHEVAHPLGRSAGKRRTLIADALFVYVLAGGDDEAGPSLEYRLLELDRATLTVDRLAAKLARYADLHRARDKDGIPVWRARYPTFPAVHLVLANGSRPVLERRRDAVLAVCRTDPRLERDPQLTISVGLLADLQHDGPFAPIFLDRHGDRVDWLNRPATTAPRQAG